MATLLIIPVNATYASQTFRVALDGKAYTFRFDWNEQAGRWAASLATDGGTAIYTGRFLTVGMSPFGGYAAPDAPPGQFVLCAADNSDVPPARYDLGARCQLVYQTAF